MAKNRVKLEICGVNCNLLTEEDEYVVREMASQVEKLMNSMISAGSPFSVAAVITALSYLDEKKQSMKTAEELKKRLEEMESDLRFAAAEYKKLKTENDILTMRNNTLKKAVEEQASIHEGEKPRQITKVGELRNPMRRQLDDTGLTSFYEKK